MGTNYYVEMPGCKCCGHAPDPIHVGKSSGGWKFLFARHDDRGLHSFATWSKFLRKHDGKIKDEYGESISSDGLLRLIKKKQKSELTGLNCYSICGCSVLCKNHNQNPTEALDDQGYRVSDGHEFS